MNSLWNLILADREKRYDFICKILYEYNLPVLCGKINYPSENKNTLESDKAFDALLNEIRKEFKENIVFEKILYGFDGKSVIIALNIPLKEAKLISIGIEDRHPLGRLFDIDIYDLDGTPKGRDELGFKRRKCIICGDDAKNCIVSKKHSYLEILEAVNRLILSYKG